MEPSPEESLCAFCASRGETCCRRARVFPTRGDVDRIAALGHRDFWEDARAGSDKPAGDPAADPVWRRIFSEDGSRRVLRHAPGGGCWFLTPSGCLLPGDSRPLVCRLYPLDYNHVGVKGVHAHLCPEPYRENPALLLALLRMSPERAEPLRAALYREIGEEFPD